MFTSFPPSTACLPDQSSQSWALWAESTQCILHMGVWWRSHDKTSSHGKQETGRMDQSWWKEPPCPEREQPRDRQWTRNETLPKQPDPRHGALILWWQTSNDIKKIELSSKEFDIRKQRCQVGLYIIAFTGAALESFISLPVVRRT